MTSLTRYDAACAALAAAVKADEVMAVHIEARAIEAVGRVAQNIELEVQARTLRTRAEARLGDMIEEGERLGIIARHGGHKPKKEDSATETSRPATLKEVGIPPKIATRARKLNGLGGEKVGDVLQKFEAESLRTGRLATGVIDEALAKRSAESRRQLSQALSDASAALSPSGRQFGVVYADPPWHRKAGIGNRAYENHYGTMTWAEIIAMPVAKRVLPDAWLFLWIPRAHLLALHSVEIDTPIGRTKVKLPLAWAVAQAWGFDAYSTCCIWTKTQPESPDDHGTGLIFWDQDEILCLFKRGRGLPMPDSARKHSSNHREKPQAHSAKPTYYRDMINDMTGTVPTLELFAREDDDHVLPPNFFTWGNESKNTAEIACDESFASDTGEITTPSGSPPAANEPVSEPDFAQATDAGSPIPACAESSQVQTEDDQLEIPPFLKRNEDGSMQQPMGAG
jgi:N6-adenosine-specific RNA methylase IME4